MNSTSLTSVRRFSLLTNSPADSAYIGNLTSDNYDIISNALLRMETKWDHLKNDGSREKENLRIRNGSVLRYLFDVSE